MHEKEPEGRRYAGYGSEKGKEEAVENQRDPQQDVTHMPRHWQAPGTRGQEPGEGTPEPDDREVARGNQYGEAGKVASEQIHRDLDEHGEKGAPQQRENDQLPRRAGERAEDLPTPKPGGAK